ncbi:hypothetical protein [Microtetraspora malaysiensis]|uniref:Amidohydrolase-related domain-containing protein n=1 Tax=Microtetraspora malaysiensis TaxID=161358 RepID=A0ABW6SZ45_9ACTN
MTFHQNAPGEIRAIHEAGELGPDLVPVHANTVSDRELAWMAEAGMAISATPQAEVAATRSVSVLRRAIAHGVTLSVGVDTLAVLPIDLLGQIRLAHILLQHTDAQAMHDAGRIAAALAGEAKDERS